MKFDIIMGWGKIRCCQDKQARSRLVNVQNSQYIPTMMYVCTKEKFDLIYRKMPLRAHASPRFPWDFGDRKRKVRNMRDFQDHLGLCETLATKRRKWGLEGYQDHQESLPNSPQTLETTLKPFRLKREESSSSLVLTIWYLQTNSQHALLHEFLWRHKRLGIF